MARLESVERVAVAILILGGTPALAAGQGRSTWLTRLGRDTIAFERFSRADDRIEGDLVVIVPRVRIIHYVVTLERGSVRRYEWSSRPAIEGGGAAAPAAAVADFGSGEIVAAITRGGRTDTTRIPVTGAVVPYHQFAWGLYQLTIDRGARIRGSGTVAQWGVGARQVSNVGISKAGDSLAVDFFGSPMMAKVDGRGRLVGVDGGRTTVKIRATEVGDLDFDRLLADFTARERAGNVAGFLSPRDTVRATVAGAELSIDYGRPSKRGRQLFGGVIPFGEVWRTGANAATQLRTDRTLVFGAVEVPPGLYTLWTLPTTRGVRLIVNRQAGQWGTEYDAERDLARIEVDVEKLDAVVERFTISVEPVGDGGELRFDWDRTRWVARFRVKP